MQSKIKCPTCKKLTVYAQDNPYRPFCSERCKLVDLGEWIDGTYGIPCEDSLDATDEHKD